MTDEVFERALGSTNPIENLTEMARERLEQGESRVVVLDAFERKRTALQQAGRERDEDAIMDVMDFVVGWCSPHRKLAPTPGPCPDQQAGNP